MASPIIEERLWREVSHLSIPAASFHEIFSRGFADNVRFACIGLTATADYDPVNSASKRHRAAFGYRSSALG
jgi:hypothetical protein